MKGIVLTSHGPMAQGMLETSKLFFGEQAQLTARCLYADMNPEDFDEDLKQAMAEVDTGDGVIVICDMLFGSPCNCMTRIVAADMENDKVQVLAGLNLAMVLQALATRESGDPSVEELVNAGKDGVADVKAIIKANLQ